jgi:hypothetical protein
MERTTTGVEMETEEEKAEAGSAEARTAAAKAEAEIWEVDSEAEPRVGEAMAADCSEGVEEVREKDLERLEEE